MLHTLTQQGHLPLKLGQGLVFDEQGLPQALPDVSRWAAMNGSLSLAADVDILQPSGFDGSLALFDWQLVDAVCVKGITSVGQWASVTSRRLGRTLDGSKVHHALVELGSMPGGQQRLSQFGEQPLALGGVDGCVNTEMPSQHPIDIAVDDRRIDAECHTGDGGGGIVTNTLEFPQPLQCVGEMPQRVDLLGRLMQVACAAIVSQSLPLS